MQSRTSFFSFAIFKNTISRYYLLAILYCVAQCLVLPLVLSTGLSWSINYSSSYENLMYEAIGIVYTTTGVTAVISFFGAIAAALAVFSYLFTAKNANMMAALPVRRESMFFSMIAAIYAVVIVSNLLAILLALAVTMPMGIMLGSYLVEWFLIVIAQFTLFFSIAVLCAQITGSFLGMIAIYGIINFMSVCLAFTVTSIFSSVSFGIRYDIPEVFFMLSPLFYLFSQGGPMDYADTNIPHDYSSLSSAYTDILPWYCLAALGIFALSFFIARKRHMETAGDVVSAKPLRPIFKVLMTVVFGYPVAYAFHSIFFGNSFSDSKISLYVCLVIFSLLGYIFSEMLIQKRPRINLKKIAAPAIILAILITGSVFAADIDLFGHEAFVPNSGDVKSVALSSRGNSAVLSEQQNIDDTIALHKLILDNRDYHINGDDSYSNYYHYYYIDIAYSMNDGREVSRRYDVRVDYDADSEELRTISELLNTREAILYRYADLIAAEKSAFRGGTISSDTHLSLSGNEMYDFFNNCVLPDMMDGTIGFVEFGELEDQLEVYYRNEIWFFYSLPSENGDTSRNAESYIYPTSGSHRTNAWLAAKGVTLYSENTMLPNTEPAEASEWVIKY